MKTILTMCALVAMTVAGVGVAQAKGEACTAQLENGKKYHWVTFVGGSPSKSGYVKFTNKKFGRWTKVEHLTDRPKSKKWFWGYFDSTKISFKSKATGERWTAWMKFCEGAKISGNIYRGHKIVRQFTIDTSRVRP